MNQTAKDDGPASIVIQRRVELSDTDAAGVWHNTAAIRFMEAAEFALLARLGFPSDEFGRHPRVRVEAEFMAPVRLGDLIEIEIRVEGVGQGSVRYAYEIRRGDSTCARGHVVAALVDRVGGEVREWPLKQREALLEGGPQAPERLT